MIGKYRIAETFDQADSDHMKNTSRDVGAAAKLMAHLDMKAADMRREMADHERAATVAPHPDYDDMHKSTVDHGGMD